jgi:hypothetical protein
MPIPAYSSMSLMNGNAPGLDTLGRIVNIAYKVPTKGIGYTAYTCPAGESGTHYVTTGTAISVVFTLPAVATSAGLEYWFTADSTTGTITITAPAGTLVAYNNIAATSIAISTAGKIIGNIIHVFCDGALWISSVEMSKIVAGGCIVTVS